MGLGTLLAASAFWFTLVKWAGGLYLLYLGLPLLMRSPASRAVPYTAVVVVVGATVLMLVAIAHQSLRKSRPVAPVAAKVTAKEETF